MLALAASGLWVLDRSVLGAGQGAAPAAVVVCYALLGALIASREPGNAIGWLFCALGICFAGSGVAENYAVYALVVEPGRAGGEAAFWLASQAVDAVFILQISLLLLLIPTGRPLTPRWRIVVWMAVAGAVLGLSHALQPFVGDPPLQHVHNPLTVTGAPAAVLDWLDNASTLLTLGALACGGLSVILRFRRARGVERQQLKWFATVVVLELIAIAVVVAASAAGLAPPDLVFWTVFLALPAATAVAVLRYRLYDVDVVIRKTLVYGALTVVLVGGYLAGVSLLGLLFRAATGQSGALAVTLTTLAVAALFRPALRRIQRAVDRRFYRDRYDGALALRAFAGRLREHVDLGEVEDEVLRVVDDTLRPVHAALWLRPAPGDGR